MAEIDPRIEAIIDVMAQDATLFRPGKAEQFRTIYYRYYFGLASRYVAAIDALLVSAESC